MPPIKLRKFSKAPGWFKTWSEEIYEKRQPQWFKIWSENIFEPKMEAQATFNQYVKDVFEMNHLKQPKP